MAQDQTVRNLERISFLLALLVDKLPRRSYEIALRIVRQPVIHVSRHTTDRHILHVHGDHFDQQRFRIALVVHAAILMLLATEFRLVEYRKMMYRDFRSESGILFDKRRDVVDQ